MLQNYLKVAIRNLIKNKSQTFINVGGLTLGMLCAIIIFLVIQFDLSFDTWHPDGDRIYRVVSKDAEYGTIDYSPGGPYPLAKAIEEDIPEVSHVSMVYSQFGNAPVISRLYNGQITDKYKADQFVFVEQDYFEIFASEWLEGNPATALVNPNTIVLTESLAEKIFADQNPIGETIRVNSGAIMELEVTGVIKDAPKNSDFPFTALAAQHSKTTEGEPLAEENWSSSSSEIQTYVKIAEGVTEQQINASLEKLLIKYRSEEEAKDLDYYLQPLSDIHFNSTFDNYNYRPVEKSLLYTLAIIGLFLILTASINFINLNTAIAVSRSKEVGLRKTLGSSRAQLTMHFMGETALVTFLSLAFALAIAEFALNLIQPLLGFELGMSLFNNPQLLLFIGLLFIGITLLAGWYPARHLSGFNPIEAIKNKMTASYGKGINLRRSLTVIQFTMTQILIIGTIIMSSQILYFQSQDLGYETEAIVEVRIPERTDRQIDTFKQMLMQESSIQGVAYTNSGSTSTSTWNGNYIVIDDTVRYENNAQVKLIDKDFIETYGFTLLAGQNLRESDSLGSYLVNEAFARQIGYGDNYEGLIGVSNLFWGHEAPIVGVVKDFNTVSLHSSVEPVVIRISSSRFFYRAGIKIHTSQAADALANIQAAYEETFPNAIFEYQFLDENIAEFYEDEQRMRGIMNVFTGIAILIGCLGLFGLVSYMATTRVKEIGVRKVLGASIFDILSIFWKELGVLIGVSFAIAAPLSYYFMNQWLQDFAYRITVGFEIFALAFLGTLLIAVLTVGYKSISAAISNPVDSLKSE